jgi:tRNA (guanosine-2'-O-)-methyltransferase
VKQLGSTDLKRLHRSWRQRTDGRLALLLDSVQTPFNVGAILRTAAAMRVDHLWLCGATASPGHERTRRTALGTERYLTWDVVADPLDAISSAREDGYRVVGIELADAAVPIVEAPLDVDVCLALGHEDRGLSAAVLGACDAVAFIPQLGRVGSLNVASAAAIAMYETRRRPWA